MGSVVYLCVIKQVIWRTQVNPYRQDVGVELANDTT